MPAHAVESCTLRTLPIPAPQGFMSSRIRYLYRAMRYRLLVDRAELRFIGERLRPNQVAVDIGCHKGAYTYWLRRWVGMDGEVIAFEPQPQQVKYLRDVFVKSHFANVTLVPMGLSDAAGKLRMFVPKARGATHQASFATARGGEDACNLVDVDVTTLDAFFSTRQRGPDFLKIDVEGHESAVLAGGRKTLAKYHPTLLVECEVRHRAGQGVTEVFELLQSLGYMGSFFCKGRRRPLSDFEPTRHQPEFSENDKPPAGYVNNFAFQHPSRA